MTEGVVPNVINRSESKTTDVEYDYVKADITEEQRNSTNPEDIKACLHAGVIPSVSEGILTNPQKKEVSGYSVAPSAILNMNEQEIKTLAANSYFARDPERNLVYCSEGCILHQKSVKKNGNIRYYNRLACKQCKNKFTSSQHKEIDVSKDTVIARCKGRDKDDNNHNPGSGTKRPAREKTIKKKITYTLHMDEIKLNNRKCLSEHPFGTIKRTLQSGYFLLKRKVKVEAEMALFCLSYNLRRTINMLGTDKLIELMV